MCWHCFKPKKFKLSTCQTAQINRRLSIFLANKQYHPSSSQSQLSTISIEKKKIEDTIVKNLTLPRANNNLKSYISQQIKAQYSLNTIKKELWEITKKAKINFQATERSNTKVRKNSTANNSIRGTRSKPYRTKIPVHRITG